MLKKQKTPRFDPGRYYILTCHAAQSSGIGSTHIQILI